MMEKVEKIEKKILYNNIYCFNFSETCRETIMNGDCKNCELYLSCEDAVNAGLKLYRGVDRNK